MNLYEVDTQEQVIGSQRTLQDTMHSLTAERHAVWFLCSAYGAVRRAAGAAARSLSVCVDVVDDAAGLATLATADASDRRMIILPFDVVTAAESASLSTSIAVIRDRASRAAIVAGGELSWKWYYLSPDDALPPDRIRKRLQKAGYVYVPPSGRRHFFAAADPSAFEKTLLDTSRDDLVRRINTAHAVACQVLTRALGYCATSSNPDVAALTRQCVAADFGVRTGEDVMQSVGFGQPGWGAEPTDNGTQAGWVGMRWTAIALAVCVNTAASPEARLLLDAFCSPASTMGAFVTLRTAQNKLSGHDVYRSVVGINRVLRTARNRVTHTSDAEPGWATYCELVAHSADAWVPPMRTALEAVPAPVGTGARATATATAPLSGTAGTTWPRKGGYAAPLWETIKNPRTAVAKALCASVEAVLDDMAK